MRKMKQRRTDDGVKLQGGIRTRGRIARVPEPFTKPLFNKH